MADIEAKVKEIIMNKLGVDEGQVTPEASFTNDLGADSLDTVELVMEFEKAFNLQIPDEDAEKIATGRRCHQVHPGQVGLNSPLQPTPLRPGIDESAGSAGAR